jgi:PAP2 superfamily
MGLRPVHADDPGRAWAADRTVLPGGEAAVPRLAIAVRAAARSSRALQVVNAAISVYAVASLALVATRRVGLTSEHVILLALVAAGLVPRLRGLVRDGLPFLFIPVMFEDLGALGPLLDHGVHAVGPALFERRILGVDAGPWLQAHLGGLHGPVWWQLPLVAEYLAHFLAPLLTGAWLWWRHRPRFGGFVAAFTLVMAAGFTIYLVFPEMPPWLAAQHGIIPPVQRVVVATLQHLGGFGRLYSGADPFPDGAMPSLHVAVPTVIALSLMACHRGWPSRLWVLYPLTIGFAVVDLGEHYVADAVVGLALGAGCWGVVEAAPVLATRLGALRGWRAAGRRPRSAPSP